MWDFAFAAFLIIFLAVSIVLAIKIIKHSVLGRIGLSCLIFAGLVLFLIFGQMYFQNRYNSIHTDYHVNGYAYEWVDAPSDARTWVYVNSENKLDNAAFVEKAKQGKNLVPLAGVKISLQAFITNGGISLGCGGRPPEEVIALNSASDGAFDSGNVSIKRESIPVIIEFGKDGYQGMGLDTHGFDKGPIIIIMVKNK